MSVRWAGGALLLTLLPLSGCGAFSSDSVTERVERPSLLTRAQVEGQAAGSPQRTVFDWWRALQFDNSAAASGYYAKAVRMTPEKMEDQLALGAAGLGLLKRLRLVETDQRGDRATVLVLLEQVTDNPNGRTDIQQTARAFNLLRERDEWKLADNLYLDRTVRLLFNQAQQNPK